MRIKYPRDQQYWIDIPDVWLGRHAQARDVAREKTGTRYGETLTNFVISMALLDDWNLPGLSGNPDKWNVEELPLQLIVWVSVTVTSAFVEAFIIPKNS